MPRRRAVNKRAVRRCDVLGIGASWGGVEELCKFIAALPKDWSVPVVIVQHQHAYSGTALQYILGKLTSLVVVDVEDKDKIQPGHIYIAPANYHLLVEQDKSFSLSIDAPVNFSRPSIDVTFDCLARVFHQGCIGLIMTGANNDGSEGIKKIKNEGGYVMVQLPESAVSPVMPEAAIATGIVDVVLAPEDMVPHLQKLLHNGIE
jgi:two-component system chemotaxis response regulator CheB